MWALKLAVGCCDAVKLVEVGLEPSDIGFNNAGGEPM